MPSGDSTLLFCIYSNKTNIDFTLNMQQKKYSKSRVCTLYGLLPLEIDRSERITLRIYLNLTGINFDD